MKSKSAIVQAAQQCIAREGRRHTYSESAIVSCVLVEVVGTQAGFESAVGKFEQNLVPLASRPCVNHMTCQLLRDGAIH